MLDGKHFIVVIAALVVGGCGELPTVPALHQDLAPRSSTGCSVDNQDEPCTLDPVIIVGDNDYDPGYCDTNPWSSFCTGDGGGGGSSSGGGAEGGDSGGGGSQSGSEGGGGCGSGFTSDHCSEMEKALAFLEKHLEEVCRELGAQARVRMQNGNYRYDASLGDLYYGAMTVGQPEVRLGPATFGSNELANTIAHEEWHHRGYLDVEPNGQGANAIGDLCGAGYSSN